MRYKVDKAIRYIKYRLRSRSKYEVHSPFVYQIHSKVLKDRSYFSEFQSVETLRAQLLREKGVIQMRDFGSQGGREHLGNKEVTIRQVVKNSSVSTVYGRLLFRMVRKLKPFVILELGTSLGISTIYLAKGNPQSHVTTIEGCPATAMLAKRNFNQLGLTNVNLVTGPFEQVLPHILENLKIIDFAFIDGNHRKTPVLHYFYQLLQHIDNDSVFIIDDIHWSKEMERAWKIIQEHPSVTVTIDLFRMGLVFFKEGLSKEDFILRF